MTNSLHFSEWRNCIRAQRKVNLCAPGAPKGPKVGMFVRQYEIVCANDAGRAPRKYPAFYFQGSFAHKFVYPSKLSYLKINTLRLFEPRTIQHNPRIFETYSTFCKEIY